MKNKPKIGATGETTFTVRPEHSIDLLDDSRLAVLSTPSLIWFLEHAARAALTPVLEPNETTVGTQVDVQHLAATPLDFEVTCVARVIHLDGLSVTFQVHATDGQDTIARGVHQRRVVPIDRLARRVRKKKEARKSK